MPLTIQFLPARFGDCILLKYGPDTEPLYVLIDGGTGGTKKEIRAALESIPEDRRHLELLVVTHIDQDHIEGILRLLEEDELGFTVGDFWFNGWNHLPGNPLNEPFGAVQGERLSARILHHKLPWNEYFGGKAIVIPETGELPVIQLEGGLTLTLLSPYQQHLENLKPKWVDEVLEAGLEPGFGNQHEDEEVNGNLEPFGDGMPDIAQLNEEEFHEDEAAANGSSIAFLAEFEGFRILLAADAFPSTILASLNKLERGRVTLDLCKVSHHASAHNTSPELLEKLNCKKYMVSTNGAKFKHPAPVTIARLIKKGGSQPEIYFNYRTVYNEIWDEDLLRMEYNYTTTYASDSKSGITFKF